MLAWGHLGIPPPGPRLAALPHACLFLSPVSPRGTCDPSFLLLVSPASSRPKASREGCLQGLPLLEWTLLMETGSWTWRGGVFPMPPRLTFNYTVCPAPQTINSHLTATIN